MELKIKLKVKDVEIELTKDEALELKGLLGELCMQKTEYVPCYPYYPTSPTFPIWTWPNTWGTDATSGYLTCDNTVVGGMVPISDNVQVSYTVT